MQTLVRLTLLEITFSGFFIPVFMEFALPAKISPCALMMFVFAPKLWCEGPSGGFTVHVCKSKKNCGLVMAL